MPDWDWLTLPMPAARPPVPPAGKAEGEDGEYLQAVRNVYTNLSPEVRRWDRDQKWG